jgi:hypothetical protein
MLLIHSCYALPATQTPGQQLGPELALAGLDVELARSLPKPMIKVWNHWT